MGRIDTVGDLRRELSYLDDDTPIGAVVQPHYPMTVSIVEVFEDIAPGEERVECRVFKAVSQEDADEYYEGDTDICSDCEEPEEAHRRTVATQAYLRMSDHENYFNGDEYR